MFKKMSAVWTSDQLPSLGPGSAYDQGLPQINEENTTRVEIQPPSPKSISSRASDMVMATLLTNEHIDSHRTVTAYIYFILMP